MHLNLSTSNFHGQIASEISHLSKLVLLDLSLYSKDFFFFIPDTSFYDIVSHPQTRFGQHDFLMLVHNLTHLSVLCLSAVGISSEVPMNLSTSLSNLQLDRTGVRGKLPNVVFQLQKLRILGLSKNENLSGSFPNKFNCSSTSPLQELDLSHINFSGELPNSIGCLKSLKVLNLGGSYLSGPIPESIGNLTELNLLDLSSNNFTGQIPDSFANLQRLTTIELSSNNLVGQIPASVASLTLLSKLRIAQNLLRGPVPSNFSGLQKLDIVSLSYNSLNGTIPSWVFRHPSLRVLRLSHNQFTGQIDEFEGNSSLELIFLNNNQLHGPIPKSISKLLNLIWLDLSSNHLSGIVELNMFSNLENFKMLFLSDNGLAWRIVNDVNLSLPNLIYLGLSSCGLKEVPEFLRNSKSLSTLELSKNGILQIPSWFTSMSSWENLNYLDFQSNQLKGPLPLFICNFEQLQILDLSNNKFTGAIPQCFGNFSSQLWVLNLKNNSLEGKIPTTFATKLKSLDLNGNFLEGSLPRSLAKCEELEVLDIGNNNISDTFPTWLENLTGIQVLILRSNRFFGPIDTFTTKNPFTMLRVIDISNNEFSGVLPTILLKSLRGMMSINRNESIASYMQIDFRGFIYYQESMHIVMKGHEIELKKIIKTLASIDVSNNRFSGEIPQVIGNLVSLRFLNLSHNRFSGYIPSTLANLSSLESLDISCNQIEGEISSQLTSLTSLAFLNLSQNQLVGRIPHGRQFDTFSNDSYEGNLGLCGTPLTKNCNDAPPPLPQLIHQQEEDSNFFNGFTWKSVIVGYGYGIVIGECDGDASNYPGEEANKPWKHGVMDFIAL
ncbi:hypothetical protein ACH5RR_009523 [Cinchona calisaya]|uniref:Receptor-like protein 12 n=1 Tax=Cinchona calisaya TaxID=153742 RepID=A0ABD3AGU7_9GENT